MSNEKEPATTGAKQQQQQQQQQPPFDAVKFAALLVGEQPSIDSALKSYASWIAASQPSLIMMMDHNNNNNTSTDNAVWTLPEILTMTRQLSRAINQHVFVVKLKDETFEQYTVCSRVWNEVAAAQAKPTIVLGRTSLNLAWSELELDWSKVPAVATLAVAALPTNDSSTTTTTTTTPEQDKEHILALKTFHFVDLFGRLLRATGHDESPDSRLIWDADKGLGELQRRSTERNHRAASQKQHAGVAQAAIQNVVEHVSASAAQASSTTTVTIEEID